MCGGMAVPAAMPTHAKPFCLCSFPVAGLGCAGSGTAAYCKRPAAAPLLDAGTSVQVVMDVSGEQNAGAAVLCCCGSRRMGHEGERGRGDALLSIRVLLRCVVGHTADAQPAAFVLAALCRALLCCALGHTADTQPAACLLCCAVPQGSSSRAPPAAWCWTSWPKGCRRQINAGQCPRRSSTSSAAQQHG